MVSLSAEKRNDILGAGAGFATGIAPIAYIVHDTFKPFTKDDAIVLRDMTNKLMPPVDTFEATKNITEKLIKEEGLAEKGVQLLVANNTPESCAEFDKLLEHQKPKRLVDNLKMEMKNGCNACFYNDKNTQKVIISNNGGYSMAYHELGHAKNFNSKNIFMKTLVKARNLTPMGISVVAPIALAVAMFHKVDKTKSEKDKGKVEKTLDFVANHAGKLTLASYLPMVAEEGIASAKGIKMAKKYLSPEQISKLKVTYSKAGMTYVAMAAVISGAVGAASYIKNKIANKKAGN